MIVIILECILIRIEKENLLHVAMELNKYLI